MYMYMYMYMYMQLSIVYIHIYMRTAVIWTSSDTDAVSPMNLDLRAAQDFVQLWGHVPGNRNGLTKGFPIAGSSLSAQIRQMP